MPNCPRCNSPRLRRIDHETIGSICRTFSCPDCTYNARVLIPKMAPGQTPYTPEEEARLHRMIADAAESDPGEENEP